MKRKSDDQNEGQNEDQFEEQNVGLNGRQNDDQNEDRSQLKQTKEVQQLMEKIKSLERENNALKSELESNQIKNIELEDKLNDLDKELKESKKINTIQENCIENSESEILRLNECIKVTELLLHETVEVSEKIIADLKSKLKSNKESILENQNNTENERNEVNEGNEGNEGKGQPIKRKKLNKPSFYLELNRNNSQKSSDFNNKSKRELRVLRHEMSDDLRHLVIQVMRQLLQSVDTLEQLPQVLTKKLNKTFGKFWFCFIGENLLENSSLISSNNYYLKCVLNEKYQVILFRHISEFSHTSSNDTQECPPNIVGNDQMIRVIKKSHNIEAQVEKFIVNTALDSLNRNFEDYHILSSIVRDGICNKFNSQWFVSVGQTQHYCTSWALTRSRKFMLFEIGNIKFTIGEVAGWLW